MSGDCRPHPEIIALLPKIQTVMIHEATFVDEAEEAVKRFHSTIGEVLELKQQYGID